MPNDLETPVEAGREPLGTASTVARLALIGVVLAAIAGSFGYLGGWFTTTRLTPARFIDGFEEVNGVQTGFRRNHPKGLGVSGFFESNGAGTRLSKASVFRPGSVPVIGRFSFGGGVPYVADKPEAVRGMGIQFSLPDGELWRTSMISLPLFPFKTPEPFYEQMMASKPDPETGKPDKAKMDAFLARHPETGQALKLLKNMTISSGFEDTTFHGLNAFQFTNAAGGTIPVRWIVKPIDPPSAAAASKHANYLFDSLIAAIHKQPLRWRLIIIVGQPGDSTNDATIPWPEGREEVNVGTLTFDRVESEETSPATGTNFDPLVLPAGIAPSDDPLLSARSAAYSVSYTRRSGEARGHSAITPAEVRKGE